MKAFAALVIVAVCAYGAISVSATTQTKGTVQKSLDRMTAVEAALK